ncbi:MAG: DUF971 domain-containing protein [Chloroflexota bacterium]
MKPISITAHRQERELSVTWEDSHVSNYPFVLLRAGCPCVECRGGHENMTDKPDPEVFTKTLGDSPATRLKTLVPVGSYAITPVWEDSHEFGIYSWYYLRALCPCETCQGK